MNESREKLQSRHPRHSASNIRVAVCIETREGPGRERLLGIFRNALERGWSLFLVRGDDVVACRQIASLQLDGAILYDREPALHRALRKLRIPLVEASARNLKLSDAAVYADDDKLTRIAAEHLLSAGFEHFGYCGLIGSHQSEMRARHFRSHLAREGGLLSTFMEESWHDIGVSLDKLIQWLQQLPKPAGVLACDDRVAERILTACRAAGITVPDQIGVLGVGNDELMCEVAWPRLSSISLPIMEIARRAVEVLEDLLLGRTLSQRNRPIAPLEVIARTSTDKHVTSDPIASAAIKYIQANGHLPIGTDQVAVALQLTRRTLERHFVMNTGWTVHDFLVKVRLRHAKRLLRQSDASLGEIALHCGYQALSAFTRMFSSSAGLHPSAYRKLYREASPALPSCTVKTTSES
jgi:LacI family transcriptional regulator